jgi:predicted GNAT family acetyltransferase
MSEVQVVKSEALSRYELVANGEVAGFADFKVAGEEVHLVHTEIDPRHAGKGYGSMLAAAVLEDIRAQGQRAVAECDFMAAYIRKRALG